MTNQAPQQAQSDPWETWEREGFEQLEKFRGWVKQGYWSQGDFGIQLCLRVGVEIVQLPIDQQGVTETILFYSIGGKSDFQLAGDPIYNDKNEQVGYTDLWSPSSAQSGQQPGFVKTSKFWMLVRRCIDIKAGIGQKGDPTNSQVWNGLHVDWEREAVEYKNLDTSYVTLPVLQGVQQAAPVSAPMNGTVPMAASSMAAPAPTSSATPAPVASAPMAAPAPVSEPSAPVAPSTPAIDWASLETAGWPKYVESVVRGEQVLQAKTKCQRDANISGNSTVMTAIFQGGMLDWMAENGWLVVAGDGTYGSGSKVS